MKRLLSGMVLAVAAMSAMSQTPATISPAYPLPVQIVGGGGMAATGDSQNLTTPTPVLLFGGATPAHGFEIQVLNSGEVWFSDVGTASAAGPSEMLQGGVGGGGRYSTPSSYVPGGPVSVMSPNGAVISARSW